MSEQPDQGTPERTASHPHDNYFRSVFSNPQDAASLLRAYVPQSLGRTLKWATLTMLPGRTSAGGHRPEPELDRLSNILRTFNEHFGDIRWEDADRVTQRIIETIPARVAADSAFRNARQNSDRQNARIEDDKALLCVTTAVMRADTELFKQFMDNASFKRWLNDTVFDLAYEPTATPHTAG